MIAGSGTVANPTRPIDHLPGEKSSCASRPVLETRVLGALGEKERTVPDTYPLTLDTLTADCNQKTSRLQQWRARHPRSMAFDAVAVPVGAGAGVLRRGNKKTARARFVNSIRSRTICAFQEAGRPYL